MLFCSYVIMREWPVCIKRFCLLSILSGIMSYIAWALVVSPLLVLILWGVRLIEILEHDTIGLAVLLPGTSLLLACYAVMLWWRTRWQSSSKLKRRVLNVYVCHLFHSHPNSAIYLVCSLCIKFTKL